MLFLYFCIACLATIFGSLVGLGGGVIIKPVLDAIATYDISTIGVLSSFTVFAMAIVSTTKQIIKGFKVEKSMAFIALGSIVGGGFGSVLFDIFIKLINNDSTAKAIQGIILASLLLIVLFKDKIPKYHIKSYTILVIVGVILGIIASFLGIGGGPINVMILVTFLNMDIKKSAITSVLIILLSQFAKLTLIWLGLGFGSYNLIMLYVMIPGGIVGGLVGSSLNHKLSNNVIHKIFNIAIIALILLNFYNVFNNIFN